MARDSEQLFSMVQDISNNVLVVVKDVGDLNARIVVCTKGIEGLEYRINNLESRSKQIVGLLSQKMEPERCMYMHEQIETRIRKWTTDYIKGGVKGWGLTVMNVLKVVAYVSVTLGSGVWGAKLLGLIRTIP